MTKNFFNFYFLIYLSIYNVYSQEHDSSRKYMSNKNEKLNLKLLYMKQLNLPEVKFYK